MWCWQRNLGLGLVLFGSLFVAEAARAELKTWDSKHAIDRIEVTVV